MSSGKILVASNASAKRPVASLTKIALAAVTVDWATATNTDLGTNQITVPQTITLVGGPNPMNLQPGDQLSLRDALYSAHVSDNRFEKKGQRFEKNRARCGCVPPASAGSVQSGCNIYAAPFLG